MARVAALAALVAAVASAGASAAEVRPLQAWAAAGGKPLVGLSAQGFRGPLVRHLAPGTYRIRVRAQDDSPFHLFGPGVNRRTAQGQRGRTIYTTWTVQLQRGRYRYRAEGYWAGAWRSNGIQVERTFVVP
jgi:hypothetical protein